MSGDQLDLDAIEARAQWARLDYQSVTAQKSAMDVPALVAEVRRLRDERDRLALLLGRRMTGPEIGAALSHMIDSGALVIPPEGCPTLTAEQVRAEFGRGEVSS